MTAPERIWAVPSIGGAWDHGLGMWSPDETGVSSEETYILATPDALSRAPEVQALIRAAVEAERERMMVWCAKRRFVSQKAWEHAARKAIAGDMADLRNRIAMIDAGPMDIRLSAAAIRRGDTP